MFFNGVIYPLQSGGTPSSRQASLFFLIQRDRSAVQRSRGPSWSRRRRRGGSEDPWLCVTGVRQICVCHTRLIRSLCTHFVNSEHYGRAFSASRRRPALHRGQAAFRRPQPPQARTGTAQPEVSSSCKLPSHQCRRRGHPDMRKPRMDWPRAFGEFVIIATGVLAALAVDAATCW